VLEDKEFPTGNKLLSDCNGNVLIQCLCHRGEFVLDEHVALFDKYDGWRMKEYAAFRRQRLDTDQMFHWLKLACNVLSHALLPKPFCGLIVINYYDYHWPLSVVQKKKLETTHHKFHRRLLGICRKDKVRNEEVREQTNLKEMNLIIKERRLRWLGHVLRMEDDRIPKQAMYWQMDHHVKRKQEDRGKLD